MRDGKEMRWMISSFTPRTDQGSVRLFVKKRIICSPRIQSVDELQEGATQTARGDLKMAWFS